MNRIPLRSPTPTFTTRRESNVAPPLRFSSTPTQPRPTSPLRTHPTKSPLITSYAPSVATIEQRSPLVTAVPCPHCGIMAVRGHQRKCPKRETECPMCNLHLSLASRELHMKNECPARIVSCPGCGGSLEYHRLVAHLSSACNARSFVCKPCGEVLSSPLEFIEHALPRCRAELFSCQLCNKSIPGHQLAQHYAICAQGVLRHATVVDPGNRALVTRSPARHRPIHDASGCEVASPLAHQPQPHRSRASARYDIKLHPNHTHAKELPIPRSAKSPTCDAPRIHAGRSTTPNARRDIISPGRARRAAPTAQQEGSAEWAMDGTRTTETTSTTPTYEAAVGTPVPTEEPPMVAEPPLPPAYANKRHSIDNAGDSVADAPYNDFVEMERIINEGVVKTGLPTTTPLCESRVDSAERDDRNLYDAVAVEREQDVPLTHRASSRSQLKEALSTSLLPRRPPSTTSSPTGHRPAEFHVQSSPPHAPLKRVPPLASSQSPHRPLASSPPPSTYTVPTKAPRLQPSRRVLTNAEVFGHLSQHTTKEGLLNDKRYKQLPHAEQTRVLQDWQLAANALLAREKITAAKPTTPTRCSTPPSTPKRPFKLS